jgi:large repetitive protein
MNHLKIFTRISVIVLALVAGMTNRASAQSCPESSVVTVNVVPEATISTAGSIAICSGSNATLTATASGGTGSCTYGWQSSPTGAAGTWTTISSATTNTLNVTGLSSTTQYRAFYVCAGTGCDTAFSPTPAVVTVNPVLTISDPLTALTECRGGTGTISVIVTGGSGTYTYNWEVSTTSATGPWTAATNANSSMNTYQPPSGTSGTYYYKVTVSSAGGCADVTSNSTVIISDPLAATNPSPIIECIGGAQTLTSVVTGGSGTITYQWQVSLTATGTFTDVTTGTGGTTTTYTPSATTSEVGERFYRMVATATGDGCGTATTTPVRVEVQPQLSVTRQLAPITECINGTDKLVVEVANGVGAITYTWQYSEDGGTNWDPAPSATNSNEYTPPSTIASDRLYRVLVNAAGNSCTQLTVTPVRVQVVAPLSIAANINDITECVGTNEQLSITVTGGVTLNYNWEVSSNGTSGWSPAPNAVATSNTYTPANTTFDVGTKYYRVTVTSTGSNCITPAVRVATVVVTAPLTVSTQPAPVTECVGGTLTMTASTTGGSGVTYQWQESDDNGVADTWADVSGQTTTSLLVPSGSAGTKYYRLRVRSAGTGCTETFSNSATATILAKPIVTATSAATDICVGGGIELRATYTGGTGTCTIQWQSAATPTGTFTDIPGATGTPWTTPAQTVSGQVHYKAVVRCDGNGCCN